MLAKKIITTPLRYQLFNKKKKLFSIGKKTFYFFFDQNGQLNSNFFHLNCSETNLVKEIAQKEFNFLLEELTAYLVKRDVSPRKLNDWLDKREIHLQFKKKLINQLKRKKFYDPQRYLENFIFSRYETAKKPWWMVKKELIQEGYPVEEVDNRAFKDLAMLKSFYLKQVVIHDRLSFIKKLQKSGFSYETIKALVYSLELE